MKKKASHRRRLFLTKNFIMMLVMLVVIIVAVSAWFTQNKTVTADSISVKAKSSSVEIAEVIHTTDANGEHEGPGEFSDRLEFKGPFKFIKDCTGDGESLIIPEFNVTKDFDSVRVKGGKEVNENQSGKKAVESHEATEDKPDFHYYRFEFYLRSSDPDVYLDSDSILISGMEKVGSNLFTADGLKSDYGNNADGLVGAMRVSLIAQACPEASQTWTENNGKKTISDTTATLNKAERQLLWDPRPDVHLDIPSGEKVITGWSITQTTDLSTYSPMYYLNKPPTEEGLIAVTEDPKLKVSKTFGDYVANGNTLSIPHLDSAVNISTFTQANGYNYKNENEIAGNGTVKLAPDNKHTGTVDLTDYYLTKYTMNVWIEGTDNEARRAMDGGEFYLTLKFK